jgi:hypothetical protein
MKLRTKILLAACGLTVAAGLAYAQVTTLPGVSFINPTDLFQDVPNGVAGTTSVYATGTQLRTFVLSQGGGVSHTGAPALTTSGSTCGGSTAALTGGSDVSGQVAEGSSASTSCVITFSKAFVTAPECFVSLNNVADGSLKCATSTTALTVTQTSASSNVLNYLVVGLPGG